MMALLRIWYTLAIWWTLRCVIAIVLDWRKRRRMTKLNRAIKILAPLAANELGISAEEAVRWLNTFRTPLVGYDLRTQSLFWVDRSMSKAAYDDAKTLGISLPAAVIDKEDDNGNP